MKSAPAQLSVRNVRKSFTGKAGEVRVLDDLSFDINARARCNKILTIHS